MGYMPMNTAIRYEAKQMRCAGISTDIGGKRHQGLVLEKRSILYCQINLAKVHRHNSPSANIGMAHFGIAHLAARQTNLRTMGDQLRIRTLCH